MVYIRGQHCRGCLSNGDEVGLRVATHRMEQTMQAVPNGLRGADANQVPEPSSVPTRVSFGSEAFTPLTEYLLADARHDFGSLQHSELHQMLSYFHQTDQTADALVAAMPRTSGRARRQFELALESGIERVADPLPEITAFFETVDRMPETIDMDLVDEGARCVRRIDPLTTFGAGWSLGFLLAAILPATAASLSANARTYDNPGMRLRETMKFVLDATQPRGYTRFGPGTKTACRLRVMHAAVRAQLDKRGWDESVYGAPISIADTLGGSWALSLMPILAAKRAGYRLSAREEEAVAHFAACAAFRQGVPDELLFTTTEQQLRWLYVAFRFSADGVDRDATLRLMGPMSTMRFPGVPALAQPLTRSFLHGYARMMFGDELCDRNDIPRSRLTRALPLTRPAVGWVESARTHLPPAAWAIERMADATWNKFMPRIFKLATDDATHYENLAKSRA